MRVYLTRRRAQSGNSVLVNAVSGLKPGKTTISRFPINGRYIESSNFNLLKQVQNKDLQIRSTSLKASQPW